MTEIHFRILEELRKGPRTDRGLSDDYGANYIEYLSDIRANDHPLWQKESLWKDQLVKIYFIEKPGQELAPCIVCTSHRRTQGPFCSIECESNFLKGALSGPRKRQEVSQAPIEATEEYLEPDQNALQESSAQSPRDDSRLSTIVEPATIMHLAKKARIHNLLTMGQRSLLIRAGRRLYNGDKVPDYELRDLDDVLDKCVKAGLPDAKCHFRDCRRCHQRPWCKTPSDTMTGS